MPSVRQHDHYYMKELQTASSFHVVGTPKMFYLDVFFDNLVIVGDLIRESIAHEVALKISETSYLPVRSFGLEVIVDIHAIELLDLLDFQLHSAFDL